MCLITPFKEPKIAAADMPVYKRLNEGRGVFSSLPRDYYLVPDGYAPDPTYAHSERFCFNYKLGELYSTEIRPGLTWVAADEYEVEYLCSEFPDWAVSYSRELICLGEGFHSALTLERINLISSGCFVYECRIPAGSTYYESPTGLLISNQIIILKQL